MLITGFLVYFRLVAGGGGLVSAARFPLLGGFWDSDVGREDCCSPSSSSPAIPPPLEEELNPDSAVVPAAALLMYFFGILDSSRSTT